MRIGVQFTGTISAQATQRWFTHSWPQAWHVIWSIVPTTPGIGSPQIEWSVAVEKAATTPHFSYWITVKNLKPVPVNIEARYAIMN